jgi:predicted secreted protein
VTLAFGLALYFMIWWLVLFTVLPFGVRTQEEVGEVVPGTPASAPDRPQLVRIFTINTALAAVVFGIVWIALGNDFFYPAEVPPAIPGTSKPLL